MAIDKTILSELGTLAEQVYDETKMSANTHTRVGQAFIDTHDLFEEVENDEADIAELQEQVATNTANIATNTESISNISPSQILAVDSILESATINRQSSALAGKVVWVESEKTFAWAVTPDVGVPTYYNNWLAYDYYPAMTIYALAIAGGANTGIWYYVQSEGAFYWYDGESLAKITSVYLATSNVEIVDDCDYLLGVKDGKCVRIAR